jgi:hypothetical protein
MLKPSPYPYVPYVKAEFSTVTVRDSDVMVTNELMREYTPSALPSTQ